MAQFIPSIEKIKQFTVQPTEGEWTLLRFLEQTLDDSFEVYFNPFLNGDRPDVVIMRRGGGVMIIEVKDWDLDLYKLDEKKHWHLKFPKNDRETHAYIKSPIDQSLKYKENLYNLHVEKLLEYNIRNPKLWGVITCGVYFHNSTRSTVQNLLVTPYKDDKKYTKFISYIELLGKDDLESENFKNVLSRHYLLSERPSGLFSDWFYDSIHHLLIPPLHLQNQGLFISRYDGRLKKQSPQTLMFSKKQDELIFDKDRRQQWRVKGVVGSGKTTLLAAKAVQSYKELVLRGIENPKILILTYNITLKNFIHDKLQQVREEFDWASFTILNYHQFINAQLNNLGIDFRKKYDDEPLDLFFARYYDNYNLFAEHAAETERFDVVFIDEIQDYKRVWMDIIKDCFLYENGTYPRSGYYLLGDVKQNIYNRRISGRDVVTNVLGVNTLETCFRSDMKIKDLAVGFQQRYFENKYEIDSTLTAEQDSLFANQNLLQGYLNYIYLQGEDPIRSVFNIIEGNIENKVNNVSINDITVLGIEFEFLKLFDIYYRYKTGRGTSTMFETYESMFLQGIREKSSFVPTRLKRELIRFLQREKDYSSDRAEKQIAVLLSIYEIYNHFPEDFKFKLESKCAEFKCSCYEFITLMENFNNDYKSFRNQVFIADYKYIRDNKKFNFWMNTGFIKISSIHSFKGWESDTIFLILQKKKEADLSFDELLYTGLTRTRRNLIVINLGNKEYHDGMKNLIDTYK